MMRRLTALLIAPWLQLIAFSCPLFPIASDARAQNEFPSQWQPPRQERAQSVEPTPQQGQAQPVQQPVLEDVIGYAFAKASPLQVFDTAALENGHSTQFDFGMAYEVLERTNEFVRVKLV